MKNIVIDTSSFFVTLKCNLRCKHCCTGAPYANNPEHFPLEDLKRSVSRYFETVKFIRKFSFTGGEPLLRPDLDSLTEWVLKYKDQFEVLEVVTNGTMLPSDKLVDIISKNANKMYVMIDRYGTLSKNADQVYDIFKSRSVRSHIREYSSDDPYSGGWVDLGSYAKKHAPDEAEKLFKTCNIVNKKKINTATKNNNDNSNVDDDLFIVYCTLFNGQLHYCGRSAATLRTLNPPGAEGDYVDITDPNASIEEIREKIIKMYTSNIPFACSCCNGELDGSPRVIPAQQLT